MHWALACLLKLVFIIILFFVLVLIVAALRQQTEASAHLLGAAPLTKSLKLGHKVHILVRSFLSALLGVAFPPAIPLLLTQLSRFKLIVAFKLIIFELGPLRYRIEHVGHVLVFGLERG